MRSYSSVGIVLARRNLGEADRTLILYSKDQGKVSLVAKGIRRTTSRKRGHLEVFSYIKFQASKGSGMDMITEAQLIDNFDDIRGDLKKVAVAYFFAEVISKIGDTKNEKLFDLLLDYLIELKGDIHLKNLRDNFTKEVLIVTGFWPEGKILENPDLILEEILEKRMGSIRVGRKITT